MKLPATIIITVLLASCANVQNAATVGKVAAEKANDKAMDKAYLALCNNVPTATNRFLKRQKVSKATHSKFCK